MNDLIKQIRTDLRLSMSGAVSASMRSKGVNYRMNFGVSTPRIKQISEKYSKDKLLAETLWKEDVRELKILATILYPWEQYTKENANKWILDNYDQEMREQLCKNLFQNLSFADELVEEWASNETEYIRATAYWLFARLCIIKSDVVDKIKSQKVIGHTINDLRAESLLLRQSALNALKFYGRLSEENASFVLQAVNSFEESRNAVEVEMFNLLKFEFGYDN